MISAGLGAVTGATLGSVTGAVSGPGLIGVVAAPTAVDCAALDPALFFASFLETATPATVPAATAAEPAPSLATFFTLEVAGLTTRLEDNFLGAAFRDDAFLAGAFFATAFLAGDFLAGDFLAGAFFAGAFLAGAFLAGDFLAGDFLAGAFFATAFLAGAFFAGAFFAGAFLAADERTVLEPAAMAPLLSMTEGSTSAPKSAMPTERVSHILTRSAELAFFWILSIWILTFHSYRR